MSGAPIRPRSSGCCPIPLLRVDLLSHIPHSDTQKIQRRHRNSTQLNGDRHSFLIWKGPFNVVQ